MRTCNNQTSHAAHGSVQLFGSIFQSSTEGGTGPSNPATPALIVNLRGLSCVSTKRSVQAHHCSFDCNCPKGNSPVFPPGECVEFSPPQKQISLLHGRIFQMFSLRERSQTLMSTYCVLPVHTKFRSWSIIMGIEQWLP